MAVDCKKCGYGYCPVCKDKCPKCGKVDIADEKTMQTRRQMKEHMNRNKKRYFAYGSNMSEEQMAEPDRAPDAQKVEAVELPDHEFFIDARSVASIREKQSMKVIGIIYLISKEDEERLDKKEGFPKYYIKKDLPIINAFAYVDQTTEEGKPRDGYMEKIIKAAEYNDFPKEYITELQSWLKK